MASRAVKLIPIDLEVKGTLTIAQSDEIYLETGVRLRVRHDKKKPPTLYGLGPANKIDEAVNKAMTFARASSLNNTPAADASTDEDFEDIDYSGKASQPKGKGKGKG